MPRLALIEGLSTIDAMGNAAMIPVDINTREIRTDKTYVFDYRVEKLEPILASQYASARLREGFDRELRTKFAPYGVIPQIIKIVPIMATAPYEEILTSWGKPDWDTFTTGIIGAAQKSIAMNRLPMVRVFVNFKSAQPNIQGLGFALPMLAVGIVMVIGALVVAGVVFKLFGINLTNMILPEGLFSTILMVAGIGVGGYFLWRYLANRKKKPQPAMADCGYKRRRR